MLAASVLTAVSPAEARHRYHRDGDGWRVTGSVAALDNMPRNFNCTCRGGRVTEISFR